MASQVWILYALVSALLWGCGYTILAPVSRLISNDVISMGYGASLFIVNFLYNTYTGGVDNFAVLSQGPVALKYFTYVAIFILGNFLNLKGYSLATQNGTSGLYSAICSIYPVFTIILSAIFLGQTNYNLSYVIPGMGFILIGTILLAFGKA